MSKKKRKFLNREVIELFRELGYEVEEFNNGNMFKIAGKVDVYKNSPKINIVERRKWITTTPATIVKTIHTEINRIE